MTAFAGKKICGVRTPLMLLALLLMLAAPSFPESAEEGKKDAAASVEIAEVGASIVASADGLKVARVAPAAARAEKYRDVDIKKGDRIVSINGQRISTLAELRTILSTVKVGEQVRLGSLRSGGPALTVYTVGSEEDLKVVTVAPTTQDGNGCAMVKMSGEPPAHGGPGGPGEPKMVTIKAGPGSVPLLELAAIVENVKGQVVVAQIVPVPVDIPAGAQLKEGDVIKSLQGQKIANVESLMNQFQAIKAGENVTLEIARDGKDERLTFAKPKMPGSVMYKAK
jgi:S1-C subfamily serine protease